MAATGNAVLVVDNSDHRRAGSWFGDCLAGFVEVEIAVREDVKTLRTGWRAVILTGSERSIFEDADWLAGELAFARRLLDEGVPVLGVCFGHQLIFRALYGKDVLTRRALPEVGWVPVKLASHPAFEGVGETIRPYNFHFDEVAEIPAGWEAVASSEACRLHGLCHGELPVLALQFHPEVSPREGVAGIWRGAQLLAGYGLDAASITAGSKRGRRYPEIVRNFVAAHGR
ncbi:MAG TPA: type 1 glutamine amidotransferase [bacterium]|nr:type 1 glutamine amidotransferase [bacterium]